MPFKSWQNQVLAFKGTPFKGIMECYFHLYFFLMCVWVVNALATIPSKKQQTYLII